MSQGVPAARLDPSTADQTTIPQPLGRPFRVIVFDWDGTAVTDRRADATELAAVVERLSCLGVWIVVVTGTNFGHVDRQLCRLVAPAARRRLLVCANRGSEVYGFDPRGAAARRWLRTATQAEEKALTAIAEQVRDIVIARTGLDVRIVYDRLNRRKIDLIPLPQWVDPPKARIGELLDAVEHRLSDAGLPGGLREVVALTQRLARKHGLPGARITSDVKHVEVGLTDKGDSLAWVKRELLGPQGIVLADVLIAGDEFGPVSGFPGSDDRLRSGARGAAVVSVGAEPNGVPLGVVHLAGGPARFRALLADQIRLHREEAEAKPRVSLPNWVEAALSAPTDAGWQLVQEGYRPALEHDVESRLAIGNGFLGARASLEQPTKASRARTFVAGLFDAPPGEPAVPALVPGPDWLGLRISIGNQPLSFESGDTVAHRRVLDFRRGLLLGEWRQRDGVGRLARLRTVRFVSLARRALGIQLATLDVTPPTTAAIEASLEPPDSALQLLRAAPELHVWRTSRTPRHLALASVHARLVDGRARALRPAGQDSPRRWTITSTPNEPVVLARLVVFARVVAVAGGGPDSDPAATAAGTLRRARRDGLPAVFGAHARAWARRWAESDVILEGDDGAQQALRFAVYHLTSAANPEDERVSIGARALTGDAYLGHVFWDTEIFLLPFYTLTWPKAARAMLMYRFHTLSAARGKAARLGFRGALYAWESADTGEEATPSFALGPAGQVIPIRCGTDEQHISADVAYAVWQYWQASGDSPFLLQAGAEIILETARFWANRAMLEPDGRYHIRGVIGPDEYHEGVDDNAYTNGMAKWNLERGLEVAELLEVRWPARWSGLRQQLVITGPELAEWQDVATRLATGLNAQTGVFEQFAGFFGLEQVDLAPHEPRTAPMDVLLGPERTRRSQVIKQADVVMLLALLWERFKPEVREASFRYYEPRCGHGSSLSPAIHALVAARLGDMRLAEAYFRQAAAIDLGDTMGNAALGVHVGALGGLWQAAVFGFGGLALRPSGLRFDPRLPEAWRTLRFGVRWRARRLLIEVHGKPRMFTATLVRGRPMTLAVGQLVHRLTRQRAWTCRLDDPRDGWREAAP